jgi:hypothetical protein
VIVHAACANFAMTDQRSTKAFLTTKHTKATKVSDIDISRFLNFALFVTVVVKFFFSPLVAALPCGVSAVNTPSQ